MSIPIFRSVSFTTLAARDFFFSVWNIKDRLKQLHQIETEVLKLRSQNAQLSYDQEENRNLRSLLNLKNTLTFSTVAGSVVSRDPTGVSGTFIIDKGQGISPGDAVLDEGGNLLGIIKEVNGDSSTVLMITDGQIKIDARVLEKNAVGIAFGSHSLGMVLDLISQEVKLEKGDRVATSGLSGTLPGGLLLGFIDEQQSSESELFQRLSVIPAAKTKDLKFVLVVTKF